jgi:hypothetical protein
VNDDRDTARFLVSVAAVIAVAAMAVWLVNTYMGCG